MEWKILALVFSVVCTGKKYDGVVFQCHLEKIQAEISLFYCSLVSGIEAGFVHPMHFGILYLPALSSVSPLLEWLKWYLEPQLEQKGREPGLELLFFLWCFVLVWGFPLAVSRASPNYFCSSKLSLIRWDFCVLPVLQVLCPESWSSPRDFVKHEFQLSSCLTCTLYCFVSVSHLNFVFFCLISEIEVFQWEG